LEGFLTTAKVKFDHLQLRLANLHLMQAQI
jgi:hypothetical protein